MAIGYVTNALGGTTTTTSFSITLPTTRVGDVLILEYTHRGTGDATIGGTYSGPAFLEKHDQQYDSSARSGKTLWARATGDHAGQTVTGSGLSNSCAAIVTVYRGAKDSGDPLADATIVGEPNASGNETQAEITTVTNGAYVVLVVAGTPDVAVTSQSCTSPGALTARAEVLSTGGLDTSIAHASAAKASAGATGAFTWAQTDGVSGSWAYAIIPAPETLPYIGETKTAAPEQASGSQVSSGYAGLAVIFAAAALLIPQPASPVQPRTFVAAPQQVESGYVHLSGPTPESALPIGAAEYTVGTHQAAIASENSSWVRGTNPALIPAAVSAVMPPTTVSAPEQVDTSASWVWGLEGVAPPDPIGGANYTTGTHQAAVVSENRSWVAGTNPALIPVTASTVIVTPQVSAPEQIDSGLAFLTGPTPATAATVIVGQTVAAPEQIESGYAETYGPTPQTAAAVIVVTKTAAPERVDSGYAKLSRYLYAAVVAADVRQPFTRVSAPEQIDSATAWVWGREGVEPPDPIGGSKYTVGSHRDAYAASDGYAVKFGRYVVPAVVGADTPKTGIRIAAPQAVDSGYATLSGYTPPDIVTVYSYFEVAQESTEQSWGAIFGYTPPDIVTVYSYFEVAQESTEQSWGAIFGYTPPAGTDRPPPSTLQAAPEQIDSGLARLSRYVFPFVAGADPKIGQTRVGAPEQVESGHVQVFGQQPATASAVIPRTRTAAPEQVNSGDGWTWGPLPAALDVPVLRTIGAAPEQINSGNAHVWGLFQPEVFGTDVAIGTTLLAAPEIIETAYYGYVQLKFEGWPELSSLAKPTLKKTLRLQKPNRTHVAKQPDRTLKTEPPNRTEKP